MQFSIKLIVDSIFDFNFYNQIELLVSTIEFELNQVNFWFQKLKSIRIFKKSKFILSCQELLFLDLCYYNFEIWSLLLYFNITILQYIVLLYCIIKLHY